MKRTILSLAVVSVLAGCATDARLKEKFTLLNFIGSLIIGLSLADNLLALLGGVLGVILLTVAPYIKD